MAIKIESQEIIDMIEIAVIQMIHIEIEMITIEEMIEIQVVDVLDIDLGPRLNFIFCLNRPFLNWCLFLFVFVTSLEYLYHRNVMR